MLEKQQSPDKAHFESRPDRLRIQFGDGAGRIDTGGKDRDVYTSVAFSSRCKQGCNLVFVGHGVQAPEYGWDDYKGLDCKGKILVMLVGDPPTDA